ncbi:helix-turn-helix domain-containing protein [Herbidospora daliensis]|uniref:helix-turn-helix domain-containing protein n=1 Tax=Herbidospora daliensis TaxID=295585 RepID=UPI000783AE26|nr:helix-turn-helix domain-containing protein [Herbidospora daliensis]
MSDELEPRPDNMASRARDGKGRYDRDPTVAERDAQAAALRARSLTYQQIGDQLGISRQSAYEAVKRALADTLAEPAEAVRTLELERLDGMWQAVQGVLERKHLTVSNGKVVQLPDEDGKLVPIEDDAPILQAVDRLLKIQERRAKLLGLDTPVKQELTVDAGIRWEIVGVDADVVK